MAPTSKVDNLLLEQRRVQIVHAEVEVKFYSYSKISAWNST